MAALIDRRRRAALSVVHLVQGALGLIFFEQGRALEHSLALSLFTVC